MGYVNGEALAQAISSRRKSLKDAMGRFFAQRLVNRLAEQMGDRVLVKGGQAMAVRFGQDARLTHDVDVAVLAGSRDEAPRRLMGSVVNTHNTALTLPMGGPLAQSANDSSPSSPFPTVIVAVTPGPARDMADQIQRTGDRLAAAQRVLEALHQRQLEADEAHAQQLVSDVLSESSPGAGPSS